MATVLSKDGTSIGYDKTGSGPAILLVDGALGYRDHWGSRPLATELATDFTVVTYDRRGRGESTDTQPYAVEREIEDVEALIDAAGGSAYLYGASSGAALALLAAARLGAAKVKKLVLYEPPFSASDEQGQGFAQYAKQTAELLAANRFGDAVTLFMADLMPSEMLEDLRQSPEWPILERLAPTLAYDNAVMGDSLIPIDAAKGATMPTLVLDGGATLDFLREVADALARAMPNAERKTLAEQTHRVAPEALAPVLTAFFKSRSG